MIVSLVRHCVNEAVHYLMERFLCMCGTASEWQQSDRGVDYRQVKRVPRIRL